MTGLSVQLLIRSPDLQHLFLHHSTNVRLQNPEIRLGPQGTCICSHDNNNNSNNGCNNTIIIHVIIVIRLKQATFRRTLAETYHALTTQITPWSPASLKAIAEGLPSPSFHHSSASSKTKPPEPWSSRWPGLRSFRSWGDEGMGGWDMGYTWPSPRNDGGHFWRWIFHSTLLS